MQTDLPHAEADAVRIVIDGRIVSITTAAAFIADNREALTQRDVAALRAGRAIEIGGGAAPIVDIEPVRP